MADLDINSLSDEERKFLISRLVESNPEYKNKIAGITAKARAARVALAREDPNVFVPYILRDEETGAEIWQAPAHKQYQDMVTDHDLCVIHGHVESGKTQQLSIGRVLFELGRNPNLRVVIIKNTQEDAKKILATISNHIIHNTRLREVFPNLKPMLGAPWNTEQITVERRHGIKDPSVRVIGPEGASLGARIDFLVMDDLLNQENTRTQNSRNKSYNWIKGTLMGRMSNGMNGRFKIVFIGNAWHPDDAMFRLAKDGWTHGVYPVRDPITRKSLWPERWSDERIKEAFSPRGMGPLEAARALDCVARTEEASRFRQEWINACLAQGKNMEFPYSLDQLPESERPKTIRTFTGVDLGVGKELTHDWTVLFTIMVLEDGKFRVLQIERGKWTSPEIIEKIRETHYRYNSTILVESNAAQRYIVDFVRDKYKKIPIKPFTTRGTKTVNNKNHPEFGVEGIANEMAGRMWVIPSDSDGRPLNEETKAWIDGMLYYDPLGHTDDLLMASWIAREGAKRRFQNRLTHVDIDYLGARNQLALPSGERQQQTIQEREIEARKNDIATIFQQYGLIGN